MKSKIMFGIITLVTLMFFLSYVEAQDPPLPSLPCSFYGNLTINDEDASIGTVVIAKVDGEEVGSITTTEIGKYGGPGALDQKLVVNEPTSGGDLIIFYINGVEADQTATWISGEIYNLDLSVNISGGEPQNPPQGPSPSPSPGGGTGGGGGGGGGGSTPSNNEECNPQWSCTLWKQCENGIQTRTCSDFNNCGTNEGKPLEERECIVEAEEFEEEGEIVSGEEFIETENGDEKPKGLAAVTGAVVGALGGSGTGILIMLIIVLGGLGGYFAFTKRNKK